MITKSKPKMLKCRFHCREPTSMNFIVTNICSQGKKKNQKARKETWKK